MFITRTWAYHGMHAYGTSLGGLPANLEGHGPMIEHIVAVAFDSVTALREAINTVGAENVAGFYVEPVIGAGGVHPAPDGYLKETREIVADAGALYISDEVITGFGRVGDWFAASRFSLAPDLITFAKGVTSGYLPLGGVITSPRVAEPFWQGDGALWRHGYTYSGQAGGLYRRSDQRRHHRAGKSAHPACSKSRPSSWRHWHRCSIIRW